MPSLLSSRRAAAGVSLRATPARKRSAQATRAQPASPPISWPVMAVVGGAVTAARELDSLRWCDGSRLACGRAWESRAARCGLAPCSGC